MAAPSKKAASSGIASITASLAATKIVDHGDEDATGGANAIIIDSGGASTRVGIAGDEQPREVFPTVVARDRTVGAGVIPIGKKVYYIGHEAFPMRGQLTYKYPIESGEVLNWDDQELIYRHAFDKLGETASEHPVLLTQSMWGTTYGPQHAAQMLFETFEAPCMYIALQSVLSLYASGRTTGTVVSSGHSVTYIAPIYEGYVMNHAVKRLDWGGRHLDNYFMTLLQRRDNTYTFATASDRQQLVSWKEEKDNMYIALDIDSEMKKTDLQRTWTLPDGKVMGIETERFLVPEALFNPVVLGNEGGVGVSGGTHQPGIGACTHSVIHKCDTDIHASLYGNIILAGGNTLYNGIVPRFERDLDAAIRATYTDATATRPTVSVVAPTDRAQSSWIGASILASLPQFKSSWVTKQDYDEFGPSVVHHKCF